MSKNKVRKTVSLNKSDAGDMEIIEKISAPDFNFNSYVRRLMLEDIRREKSKTRTTKGGIKIVVE